MSHRVTPPDPDFSREVLAELYAYRRKGPAAAWLLWLALGWLGAHRFYLEREFSGLAMMLTGGAGGIWWAVDAFFINRMVREHNEEQARREAEGRPPIGVDALPPLEDGALSRTAPWTARWEARGRAWRWLRLAGDVAVLFVAGTVLGGVAGADLDTIEVLVATLLVVGVTAMGAGPSWGDDVPLVRQLVLWSHRLRLFYYHHAPPSPPVLLLRPLIGVIRAPFSAHARAEARLYVELGAGFAIAFLLLDLFQEALIPLFTEGSLPGIGVLASQWAGETLMNFLFIYALTSPIGAVLTLYLLMGESHTLPRALSAFTVFAILLGYS